MTDFVRQARELGGFSPEAELCSRMADEIERLRKALDYYARTWPQELDANDWTYVHGCKEWGVVARSTLGDEFQ